MTKWSTKTLRTGECRSMVEGAEAHRLFEAPEIHEAARRGDAERLRALILDGGGRRRRRRRRRRFGERGRSSGTNAVALCRRVRENRVHEIFVRTRRKARGERFVVQSAGGLGVTSETRGGGEAPEDQSHRDWPRDWREQVAPLRTYHEYCYDLTTEEIEERLEEDRKTVLQQWEKMREEERKEFRENPNRDPLDPIPF